MAIRIFKYIKSSSGQISLCVKGEGIHLYECVRVCACMHACMSMCVSVCMYVCVRHECFIIGSHHYHCVSRAQILLPNTSITVYNCN